MIARVPTPPQQYGHPPIPSLPPLMQQANMAASAAKLAASNANMAAQGPNGMMAVYGGSPVHAQSSSPPPNYMINHDRQGNKNLLISRLIYRLFLQ